jgi:hypothetical protein
MPLILVRASRSFKALIITKIKAFRLDFKRRAAVLKFCPLAILLLNKDS